MLVDNAPILINEYGFKGAAQLNSITKTQNTNTGTNDTVISNPAPLLSYVGRYPISQISDTSINNQAYKVLIATDEDFTGVISKDDTITINGVDNRIASQITHRVNDVIAYVEVICGN